MRSLKKEWFYLKHNYEILLLTMPGLLFLIIFSYIPMFGLLIAFKDFEYSKGIFGSKWVWFDNFKFFFNSQDAFRITRNTILYNVGFIIIGTVFAVALALILNELGRKSVKIFQTVFLMPYFLSWVIISFILYAFLNPDLGIINRIITAMGGEQIIWYSESKYWPAILVLSNLWKNVGYSSIIYYTGLIGIECTYYEAAEIDGASKLQQIFKISIPMLRPLIILLALLAIGKIFNSDFGLFYFIPMDSGILYEATDVIDTYVYRALKTIGDIGMSSAAGFYQSVVGFVLVLLSNKLVKKIDENSSIF